MSTLGRYMAMMYTQMAAEKEQREIELVLYAELPKNSEVYATINEVAVPKTVDEDSGKRKEVAIKDKVYSVKVVDHAQVQMAEGSLKMSLRRSTGLEGSTHYKMRVKANENGVPLECEEDLEHYGFNFFNIMARNLGKVMYKTRLTIEGDDIPEYEIDVPLLKGEHCRAYDAVHANVVKIDIENAGNLTAQEAMRLFPFEVVRFINDRAEIDRLYETVFVRKV